MTVQAGLLPDGVRLHLHHGPIDLVIRADGPARAAAYDAARACFDGLLDRLVTELPDLRRADPPDLSGPVARRMQAATAPFLPEFITPMAAVAGAVADEVLSAMARVSGLGAAWVNNGGDVAFHLPQGATLTAALAGGQARLSHDQPWRGIATSGRGGRSFSLGIADSVTVVARTAAAADAAATMIANHVDLPGHPAVQRAPARDLLPDSDLGERPVTTGLGPLSARDTARALDTGLAYARSLVARGLIGAAHLILNGASRTVGGAPLLPTEAMDA